MIKSFTFPTFNLRLFNIVFNTLQKDLSASTADYWWLYYLPLGGLGEIGRWGRFLVLSPIHLLEGWINVQSLGAV